VERIQRKRKRVLIGSKAEAELIRARKALKEAQTTFNRALADPKADLAKLEQAIRNAERLLARAGSRAAVRSGRM
jgi:hypothetical protein